MTKRLSQATLGELPAAIGRPGYDRSALQAGVVHIGLGAFQRAHQAPVYEALASSGDLRWGVVGASLRSPAVRDALAPQDGLYSLTVEEGDRRETSVVGILKGVIVAPQEPRRLVEAIAAPDTKMITVTVTEKGYRLTPGSGELMEDDPEVQSDLAGLGRPATMPGHIAAGLQLRRARGLPPLTILSCDNLAGNGRKLGAAVARIGRAHDARLGDWIVGECAFPNAMVDRIVPGASDADLASAASRLGFVDLAAIRTEPFTQWVIEKRFAGPVPDFERFGVQLTVDVAPWEQAKLWLLNGAHSAMAYLGGLAGIATVDRFVAEPAGAAFVESLWDEITGALPPNPQLDVPAYRRALMSRFANSALRHQLRQIAADGSQKIPQRLLASAIELLASDRRPQCIAVAVAGWMRWQGGRDDAGERFEVDDPLASTTARLIAGARDPLEQVRALLSLHSVFPKRLAEDRDFVTLVADRLDSLIRLGARAMLERFAADARTPA